MSESTTTISVRLENEKKSRLDEILESIDLSRQEALEEGVDHIIERFGILADVSPKELEEIVDGIMQKFEEDGVLEGEIGIEAIPLQHKLLLLSHFVHWSLEAHEDDIKVVHRSHSKKYEKTPELSRLVPLNAFDVQELQNGSVTREVEVPADELYHHPDRVMCAAKIRHIVLIAEAMTEEVEAEGFLKAARSNYGSDIEGIRLVDEELDLRSTQNLKENSMEIRINLPFEPIEE